MILIVHLHQLNVILNEILYIKKIEKKIFMNLYYLIYVNIVKNKNLDNNCAISRGLSTGCVINSSNNDPGINFII